MVSLLTDYKIKYIYIILVQQLALSKQKSPDTVKQTRQASFKAIPIGERSQSLSLTPLRQRQESLEEPMQEGSRSSVFSKWPNPKEN